MLEHLELQDLRDLLVFLDNLEIVEHLANRVTVANRAAVVLLVKQETLDLMVQLDHLDPLVLRSVIII